MLNPNKYRIVTVYNNKGDIEYEVQVRICGIYLTAYRNILCTKNIRPFFSKSVLYERCVVKSIENARNYIEGWIWHRAFELLQLKKIEKNRRLNRSKVNRVIKYP